MGMVLVKTSLFRVTASGTPDMSGLLSQCGGGLHDWARIKHKLEALFALGEYLRKFLPINKPVLLSLKLQSDAVLHVLFLLMKQFAEQHLRTM